MTLLFFKKYLLGYLPGEIMKLFLFFFFLQLFLFYFYTLLYKNKIIKNLTNPIKFVLNTFLRIGQYLVRFEQPGRASLPGQPAGEQIELKQYHKKVSHICRLYHHHLIVYVCVAIYFSKKQSIIVLFRRHAFNPWVGKVMTTHATILAWRITWTEEPGSPWGRKESDTTE